ncbi:MAG TPA: hypothetical protein EYH05_05690 [Anaerolineae bacterium]|nr:hypothetical protein [Anaerolineae bacterium]
MCIIFYPAARCQQGRRAGLAAAVRCWNACVPSGWGGGRHFAYGKKGADVPVARYQFSVVSVQFSVWPTLWQAPTENWRLISAYWSQAGTSGAANTFPGHAPGGDC